MWSDDFHETTSDAAVETGAEESREVEAETGRHETEAQDITQRYFEDISRLPILKADEERYYARRMRDGDDEARKILITHNLRLVVYVAKELNGCLRARSKLEAQGMSDPGPEDIARITGNSAESVRHVMQLNRPPVPLDAPLDPGSDLTLGEAIADERCIPPEERLYQAELEQYVTEWLARLSAKQRWVIERRFGLNNHETATLEELARELQVTRERVRQIQVEAQEVLANRLREKGVHKENW